MLPYLPPPVWVANPPALDQLARTLAHQTRLAVDTESNSLHAYREQVCLVQFSTPASDFLVDPLALHDLSPIAAIFSNPKIEKIFHAVEYDLICLKRDFGIVLTNIFDTMQAARILGYKQVGLDAILAEKLQITLNKHFQKADWGERPLSQEMLNYARFDTHYLLTLRDILQHELQERGRWELAQEEFVRLAMGTDAAKPEIPSWQRIKGTQHFTPRQLTILQELCLWRESQAKKLSRPVFKVIDDKHLVTIALAAPKTETELAALNLTSRQIYIFGEDIIEAIRRGKRAVPVRLPHSGKPDPNVLNRLNILSDWRKAVALKIGVESDIILPKTWMHSIAAQNPKNMEDLAVLMPKSPWRLDAYGPAILMALQAKGKSTLQ